MRRRSMLTGALGLPVAAVSSALAQGAREGTLRFVPHANLAILDPIFTTATVTSNHGYMVFDTLYGADMDLRPQPQMVERHAVSADGLRWDFTLREGLRFHDDTPVRPVDCIASLMRWCRRDVYGQLLRAAVSDWEMSNERTFTIRLSRPFPTLLNALAKVDNPAFIMPERLARTDASQQVTEMVGSGPYRFVAGEYVTGSKAVYERFQGYRPRSDRASRNAGAKVAHFARVEWLMLPDPATAASALMRGEIDW